MFTILRRARWPKQLQLLYYHHRHHRYKCRLLQLYHQRHRLETQQHSINDKIRRLKEQLRQQAMKH